MKLIWNVLSFKVAHRLHSSEGRIAKMYPAMDNLCNRCNFSPATLARTVWSCPRRSGYWSSIFNALSKIFKRPINPNPLMAIYGIQCEGDHLPRAQSDCIAFVTHLARGIILHNCKQSALPSYKHWVRDTQQLLKLEKIRLALRRPDVNFSRIWQPFITYLLEQTWGFVL